MYQKKNSENQIRRRRIEQKRDEPPILARQHPSGIHADPLQNVEALLAPD